MPELLEPRINGVALGEQDVHGLLCELIGLFKCGHINPSWRAQYGGNEKSGRLVYFIDLLLTGQ
jgi:hypothetical protein